jgi:hypothetical protein
MKKILSYTVKAIALFIIFFITPAVIACIIQLDFSVYKDIVTHPAYCAFCTVISGICTYCSVNHLINIAEKEVEDYSGS